MDLLEAMHVSKMVLLDNKLISISQLIVTIMRKKKLIVEMIYGINVKNVSFHCLNKSCLV